MSEASQDLADRVLAISVIQDQVLSSNTRADNARCARVCHRWQETALGHAWNEMDSLIPLLQLLAPLTSTLVKKGQKDIKLFKFSRNPQDGDWERFMHFSQRVRSLRFYLDDKIIDENILAELARRRRSLIIFPKLSSLAVGDNGYTTTIGMRDDEYESDEISDEPFYAAIYHRHWSLFLHGGLRALQLESTQYADVFIEEIIERSPMLISLSLKASVRKRALLSKLFSELICLEILELDCRDLFQQVLESIALLPKLHTLRLPLICLDEEIGKLDMVNAFPRLRVLQGDIQCIGAIITGNSPHAFQVLCELLIIDNTMDEHLTLFPPFFLMTLSSTLPSLRSLTIKWEGMHKGRTLFLSANNKAFTSLTPLTHKDGHSLSEDFEKLDVGHAFPRLWVFRLRGRLQSICTMISSQHASNLAELDILDNVSRDLTHLPSLFTTLHSTSPGLRRLTIKCEAQNPIRLRLSANVLRPLALLTHMEDLSLDLVFTHSIDIADDEFAEIFRNCSSLRTLILKTDTSEFDTTLTLGVLPLLSRHCPVLSELRLLNINACVPPGDLDSMPMQRFHNLRILEIGMPVIYGDAERVALYLSRLLSTQCSLDQNWLDEDNEDGDEGESQDEDDDDDLDHEYDCFIVESDIVEWWRVRRLLPRLIQDDLRRKKM